MFGREKRTPRVNTDTVAVFLRAECLGVRCENYSGKDCDSRMELLEAMGESKKHGKPPLREDCSYALYGQVCLGGEEQIVVRAITESPNQQATPLELIARSSRQEGQRIVLTTPADEIYYTD